MALTGMQIYKSLPKTNCKDCGLPTCMAFAMQVAAKQRALTDCPHISDEGKSALSEASAPPQRLVKIGGAGICHSRWIGGLEVRLHPAGTVTTSMVWPKAA